MGNAEINLISARRQRAWDDVDGMSPEWRAIVHEYGYPIVHACREAGVTEPRRVRELVRVIWDGARSDWDKRPRGGTLDWLLIQAGCPISAAALSQVLANENLAILPRFPTKPMIQASLDEVSGFNVRCTKWEKHRLRLTAALAAEPNIIHRMQGGKTGALP